MYNRYVPQADGSFRRSRVPEQNRQAPPPRPQPKREPTSAPPAAEEAPCPPQESPAPQPCPQPPKQEPKKQNVDSRREDRRPKQEDHKQEEHSHRPPPCQQGSVTGFLRQLLPRDFDTGDLLIVLLLLLMAGDCNEDQNTALLTLALYFFM